MEGRRGSLVVLLFALLVTPAGAAEYAPLDAPGPALTTPEATLRASLACTDDVATNPRPPVLLVPATTVTSRENFGWNWQPALRAAGFAVCTTDQPGAAAQNMTDMQDRAEYLVHAIRRVFTLGGRRRITVVGHSQGGMIPRWALRFWPDTRAMVGDYVSMAATHHGSDAVDGLCVPSCAPALWQQRSASAWTAALNSRSETFAGIDYTAIYSRADEFVTPNQDESGASSLRGGDGAVRNIALQDVCAADTSEHLLIGTTDPVAWRLGLDAITHDGPGDPARLDAAAVCAEQQMPGVDPVTGELALAEASGRVAYELSTAARADAEPPLRCYVTASCPASGTAAAPQCTSSRRFTVRADADLRTRGVRLTLDGRRLAVRLRGGRATAVVDLRGRPAGVARLVVTGRMRGGRAVTRVRRYRTCVPRPR